MPSPTFDGQTPLDENLDGVGSWSSTGTWSTTGSNPATILVIGGQNFGGTGATATAGGNSMTLLGEARTGSDAYCAVFLYAGTLSGATIASTFNGNTFGRAQVFGITGYSAVGATNTATGASGTASVSVTSASGELVIKGLGNFNQNPTQDGSETLIAENSRNGSGAVWCSCSYKAGASSSVTMQSTGVGSFWATVAASLQGAGARFILGTH